MSLTESTEESDKTLSLMDCYEVSCISISPSEENVVVSTKGNQLYSLLLSTADMTTTRTDQVSFDLLSHSFHMNQIRGGTSINYIFIE